MNGGPGVAVLDASALVAFLHDEPGAGRVEAVLRHGVLMSAVNWSEVLADLAERGGPVDESASRVRRVIDKIGTLDLLPFDEHHARQTARLRVATRSSRLSLADRACLALGRIHRLPVLTTDRAWRTLRRLSISIEVIR
jgi:PIN domain nuclease of toxin-antitoxin system